MPKKISLAAKETWLRKADEGVTVAQIARQEGHDPRTVEKGLEEARRLQVAGSVHRELLADGIRSHQGQLFSIMEQVIAAVAPLPTLLPLPYPSVTQPEVIHFDGFRIDDLKSPDPQVILNIEDEFMWKLLGEHLRGDPTLETLVAWKRAIALEVTARLALRLALVQMVASESKIAIGEPDPSSPAIWPAGLGILEETILHHLLENADLNMAITGDHNGEIFIGAQTVAKVPADAVEATITAFKSFPSKLAESQEAVAFLQASSVVVERTIETKEEFAIARAANFLFGACRACKRLGVSWK